MERVINKKHLNMKYFLHDIINETELIKIVKSEELKYILEENIHGSTFDVNRVYYDRKTILMVAAQHRHDTIKYLVEKHGDNIYINLRDIYGNTAIMLAMQYQPDCVKYLLDKYGHCMYFETQERIFVLPCANPECRNCLYLEANERAFSLS